LTRPPQRKGHPGAPTEDRDPRSQAAKTRQTAVGAIATVGFVPETENTPLEKTNSATMKRKRATTLRAKTMQTVTRYR
jgi:hypothetical protein